MLPFSLSSSALLLSPQITFRLLLLFYESRWYACRRGERDVDPCCTRLHAGHFGAALRLCMSQYSYLPSPPTAADAAALASTEGTAGGRNRGRRRRFARDGYAAVHSCPLLVTTGNAVREVEVNVTAFRRGVGDDTLLRTSLSRRSRTSNRRSRAAPPGSPSWGGGRTQLGRI